MMLLSIGIGMERVRIVRPELELLLGRSGGSGRSIPLQKQETKGIGGGSPIVAPMPKSILSCGKKRSTV